MVIKKDQRRELFSREKILRGLIKACHKRNISVDELENLAAKIEADLWQESSTEVSTKVIGERVSEALKALDYVAYVRFASVYRDFKDVKEFLAELIPLIREKDLRDLLASSSGSAGVLKALGSSGSSAEPESGAPQSGPQSADAKAASPTSRGDVASPPGMPRSGGSPRSGALTQRQTEPRARSKRSSRRGSGREDTLGRS